MDTLFKTAANLGVGGASNLEGATNLNQPPHISAGGVVNSGGNTIQNLMSKLSITGNIMVDSYIIMNFFTFAKGWAEVSFNVITAVGISVMSTIFYYISSYVKSKFTGRVVFRSSVDEKNSLYKVMFNNIIDANIDGDVQEDWKFKWLQVESSLSGSAYFDRVRRRDNELKIPVELDIDYTSPKNNKLKFVQNYGTTDRKTLIFKHTIKPSKTISLKGKGKFDNPFFKIARTFYIKVEWIQSEHTTFDYKKANADGGHHIDDSHTITEKKRKITFDLIMFDIPNEEITKTMYFDVFYDFLESRFNILFENMVFSYVFNFYASSRSEMYNYLYKTATGRTESYRSSNQGWLGYGDDNLNSFNDIINSASILRYDCDIKNRKKKLPSQNTITLQARPTSLDFDYEKNIQITTDTTKDLYRDDLFSRFLNVAGVSKDDGNWGLFQFNGMGIVMMSSKLVFLKKGGQVTEAEVYDVLRHIIEFNINSMSIHKKLKAEKSQMNVMKWDSEQQGWTSTVLSKRCFETIYLPSKFKAEIIKEFDNFVRMEKLYRKVEVPYRKGIMLYGPPGTGKTSLVRAVSYEYQMPLYILDVNAEGVNDDSIVNIMNSLGGTGLKILLFEDIDAAFADKEKMMHEDKSFLSNMQTQYPNSTSFTTSAQRQTQDGQSEHDGKTQNTQQMQPQMQMVEKKRKFLTYSGLLNAFDGVMSNQTGVITILTTNHIEKLGDAFVRAGRVDAKFELKECNQEQIETMVISFIKKSIELFNATSESGECLGEDHEFTFDEPKLKERISKFAAKLVDENDCSLLKPCDIQSYLLKYINNYDDIFENVHELIKE